MLLAASPSGGPLEKPIVAYAPDGLLGGWTVAIYSDVLSGAEREADMAIVGGNLSMVWRESSDIIRYATAAGRPDHLVSGAGYRLYLRRDALAGRRERHAWLCLHYLQRLKPGDVPVQHVATGDSAPGIRTTPTSLQRDSLACLRRRLPLIAMDSPFDYYYAAGSAPDGTGAWRSFLPTGSSNLGDWCRIAGPACLDGLAAVAS